MPLAPILVLLTALLVAPPPPADNRPAEAALRQACDALNKADADPPPRVLRGLPPGALDVESPRGELWREVAKFRHRLGDQSGALAALREARVIADKKPLPVNDWGRIATTLGAFDDAKAVLDFAGTVPEQLENSRRNPRVTVLQNAARAAAQAGHVKTAEQIVDAIADEKTRAAVRESIRRTTADAGANKDTAAALRAAEKLPTAAEKVFALAGRPSLGLAYDDFQQAGGVAFAQLQTGDKGRAKETALKALALLPDVAAKDRGMAALAVVRVLARLDDVPAARKALAQIPARDPKVADGPGAFQSYSPNNAELIAKGYIAAAEVRAERDAEAKAFVRDFTRANDQAYLFHVIALAQGRAGRKDEAKAKIAAALALVERKNADPVEGDVTRHNIISAQAHAGDIDGAVRNAAQWQTSVQTWDSIVSAQLAEKDFTGARATAEAHIGPQDVFWYLRTLRTIARSQARAGQAAAVREWAAKLDDALLRAHALFGLAEGLYQEAPKPGQ